MLLSLKSVMNTLRAPSPPFVALTALHFRAARRRIAGRCCKLLMQSCESLFCSFHLCADCFCNIFSFAI